MADRSELLRRQKALADFGDFVLDHDDLQQVLDEGCRLVAMALDADLAKVMEIERSNDAALVRAGIGWREGIVGRERVSLSERSSEAYAIEQAEPVITNDIAQEKRFHFPSFLLDHGVVALVNVPIFLPGRKPWGVLQVDARKIREFEQEDIEFLKTYSMVLGPVIDRLQKVEGLRENEEQQSFLLTLGDCIREEPEAYRKIEIAARLLGQRLGASRVLWAEFDWQRRVAHIFNGWSADGARSFPVSLDLDAFAGAVLDELRAGRTVRVDNIGTLVEEPAYAAIADAGVQALLSPPLLVDGLLKVNLSIHQEEPRQWTDAEAALVQEVADRLWAEVARARTEEALHENQERQAFLLRFTDAIRSEPNEQAVIQRAVQMLGKELASDRAYATRHYPAKDLTEVIHEVRGADLAPLPATLRFSDFPEAGRQTFERTLIFEDTTTDQSLTEADRASLAAMGAGAFLSRPLRRGGRPIFALGVVSTLPRHWTPAEVALVEEATERTWEAAERARSETALQESEAKYRTLFDTIDSGYALTDNVRDEEGRVVDLFGVDFNRSYTQHSGLPPFPGRRASDVIAVQPEWLRQYEEVTRTGVPARHENYIAERDRWVSTHYSLVGELGSNRVAVVFDDITERKRAETALRESEKKYSALFAASPAPFLVLKPDAPRFTIADVNDAYLTATMRTREDLVGRPMFEAFPDNPGDPAADGVSALRASLDRALISRRFERMGVQKYDIAQPDGTFEERWWKPANAPVVDDAGEVVAIVHHVADVTSEHRAVEALRASEDRFRRFGEASQDILWMRDAETLQWTYLTPAFEAIYGISREEAVQGPNYRRWLDLIVEEDREHAEREIEKVRSGNRVTFEYRIKRPCDGRTCWLRETNFPIANDAGKISWIGGVAHNVTELRESEEQRRTSEERLALIVENTRDYAIFTTDPDGKIDRWYVGAAAVFGWSADEAIGQLAEITFTPEDRDAGIAAGERAEAAQCGRAADVRWHQHKDGSRIFIDGVATALRDAEGALTGFLKIGQDVTERRRAEELQSTLLAELQHRVRNLLAMIRSVLRRASIGKDSVSDFVDHLEGRLDAMARTQAMLTRSPGRNVDLQAIVEEELLAQGADPRQYQIKGPPTALAPKVAEIVTLAIHELTTNSVKYGALGRQGGFFFVTWSKEQRGGEERLTIRWRETGVPIEGKPRAGFGTELLTRRVPFELGGKVDLKFLPDGLTATLEFPLRQASSVLQTDAIVTAGE